MTDHTLELATQDDSLEWHEFLTSPGSSTRCRLTCVVPKEYGGTDPRDTMRPLDILVGQQVTLFKPLAQEDPNEEWQERCGTATVVSVLKVKQQHRTEPGRWLMQIEVTEDQ